VSREHLRGQPILVSEDAEQQMLAPDTAMAKAISLLDVQRHRRSGGHRSIMARQRSARDHQTTLCEARGAKSPFSGRLQAVRQANAYREGTRTFTEDTNGW
jgi:hypothetical protein